MEVSSWYTSKRTEALHFTGGVFTNLSHDHLDYHPTFAEYRDVKNLFLIIYPNCLRINKRR
jgi:UDP-N-acetylmuramoyl-L-alanyl-D-glutamate--2,6-diaminopimelate ligase